MLQQHEALCGVEGLTEAEVDGHATYIGNHRWQSLLSPTLKHGADGAQISKPHGLK